MPTSAMRLLVPALSCLLLLPRAASTQEPLPLTEPFSVAGVRYDTAVPSPASVLGGPVGSRHSRPHELVEYFRLVDAASDRVVVAEHGRTWEGRPLVHAIVTSPANHARLEAIRQANLRLSDAPQGVGDVELARMPMVVYQGFSIHGNEASGSDAALPLLYHLAAGQGPAVERLLDSLVIIVDPSLNPDGRDRFVDWVNGQRGTRATTDGQDREHDEPWPGGRGNHYWFDLNRDWLPAVHPESQGRLALFHAWRPQLLTDHHEMGGNATFFFQPGVPSRNNPHSPDEVFVLTADLARYHAAALDRIGSLYYTREGFDDFYYGKGSTYPDVNGAVGILFEQASSRALRAETIMGELAYGFTVRNQLATALSTLDGAYGMRERFLRHQREFYRSAAEVAADSRVKGWVFGGPDAQRTAALVELLQRHRIRVHALPEPLSESGRTWQPGHAFVVPVDQPQARLVLATFERTTSYADSLFYDVSAWALPLAYGVPHAPLARVPRLGAALPEAPTMPGQVTGSGSYGWLLRMDGDRAVQAVLQLLESGANPRVATRPFTTGGGTSYPPGTVFIPAVSRAPDGPAADSLAERVERIAGELGVPLERVATGLAASGPDLGGESSRALRAPVVGLFVGSGMSSLDAGQTWHALDAGFGLPVSLLDAADVGGLDLGRYNTLVLAGSPSDRDSVATKALRSWVRGGGTLLVMPSGLSWAAGRGFGSVKLREAPTDTIVASWADADDARGARTLGGSIFMALADTTHPLAWGVGREIPVMRSGTAAIEPTTTPGTTVATYAPELVASGYIHPAARERIQGSAAIVAERMGRGAVIWFADDPTFRGFWLVGRRVVMNAILFGPLL